MALALFTKSSSSNLLAIAQGKIKRAKVAEEQKALNFSEQLVKELTPFEIYERAVDCGVNPPCILCGHHSTRRHGATPGGIRFYCVEGCGQTFSRKTAIEKTIKRPTCSVCGKDSKKVKNGTPIRSKGEIVQSWRCGSCGSTTELPVLDVEKLRQVL